MVGLMGRAAQGIQGAEWTEGKERGMDIIARSREMRGERSSAEERVRVE